jgi:predicted nucleic-acid-binding Zn-ribbon protein
MEALEKGLTRVETEGGEKPEFGHPNGAKPRKKRGASMSKMSEREISCPKCGNTQARVVWDSINVTLNPELRDKLFDADVNMFSCQKCGQRAFVNLPLLYHDMNRRFCVQYYPQKLLDNKDFFEQFTKEGELRPSAIRAGLLRDPSTQYITLPDRISYST